MATIRQHYVWQKYLRPWVSNGKIFCLREKTLLHTKTDKLVVEKGFYNIQKLTSAHLRLAYEFMTRNVLPEIQTLQKPIYDLFTKAITLRERLRASNSSDHATIDFLENFEESMQSVYENFGSEYLEQLYRGDVGFFSDQDGRVRFLLYLMMQLFRTKLVKDIFKTPTEVTEQLEELVGAKFVEINGLLVHLYSINTAYRLSVSSHRLLLLQNEASESFLTSDRPVMNTLSAGDRDIRGDLGVELFYPLTPRLGLLVTDRRSNETERLDRSRLSWYNRLTIEKAHQHLFSDTKQQLEEI